MFGVLRPEPRAMDAQARACYRESYCYLAATLGRDFGIAGRLAVDRSVLPLAAYCGPAERACRAAARAGARLAGLDAARTECATAYAGRLARAAVLADALLDRADDARAGRFNPLDWAGPPGQDAHCAALIQSALEAMAAAAGRLRCPRTSAVTVACASALAARLPRPVCHGRRDLAMAVPIGGWLRGAVGRVGRDFGMMRSAWRTTWALRRLDREAVVQRPALADVCRALGEAACRQGAGGDLAPMQDVTKHAEALAQAEADLKEREEAVASAQTALESARAAHTERVAPLEAAYRPLAEARPPRAPACRRRSANWATSSRGWTGSRPRSAAPASAGPSRRPSRNCSGRLRS